MMRGMNYQPQDVGTDGSEPVSTAPSNDNGHDVDNDRTGLHQSDGQVHDGVDWSGYVHGEEARIIFAEKGLPRTSKSIRRYCQANKLECRRKPSMNGFRWVIERTSLDRFIEEEKEKEKDAKKNREFLGVAIEETDADSTEPLSGHERTGDRTSPDLGMDREGEQSEPMRTSDPERVERSHPETPFRSEGNAAELRELQSELREKTIANRVQEQIIEKQNREIERLQDRLDHEIEQSRALSLRAGHAEGKLDGLSSANEFFQLQAGEADETGADRSAPEQGTRPDVSNPPSYH